MIHDVVTKLFSHVQFLNPIDLLRIASMSRIQSLKKGEYLVRIGDLSYSVATVVNGMLMHYVISDHGGSHALRFVPERMMSSCTETIFHDRVARENIVAVEDSLLLVVDYRKIDALSADNHRLLRFENRMLKESISMDIDRIYSLTVESPEQRYTKFRDLYPDLVQRIKQKDLASYLGITETSLSRLRARLAQK